jgi:hypothetical protein
MRDLSVSGKIPGVLGFKETKLSSSIHRRSRVYCYRPMLFTITLDEANPQGLWLQIEQSPSPVIMRVQSAWRIIPLNTTALST